MGGFRSGRQSTPGCGLDLEGDVDYAVRMPGNTRLGLTLLSLLTLASAGCSTTPAPSPEGGSLPPAVASAVPPAPPAAAATVIAAGTPGGTAGGESDVAPPGTASGEPGGSAGAAPSAAASAAPSAGAGAGASPGQEPPASLKVANIGMHIGGGPNDGPTKEPIKRSVEPHFDALRRCFTLVEDQKKSGDFGLDLLIPKDGGRAEVSHPRTSLKGEGFQACVVKTFEGIDFKKPKTGRTMVSYSIRYSP